MAGRSRSSRPSHRRRLADHTPSGMLSRGDCYFDRGDVDRRPPRRRVAIATAMPAVAAVRQQPGSDGELVQGAGEPCLTRDRRRSRLHTARDDHATDPGGDGAADPVLLARRPRHRDPGPAALWARSTGYAMTSRRSVRSRRPAARINRSSLPRLPPSTTRGCRHQAALAAARGRGQSGARPGPRIARFCRREPYATDGGWRRCGAARRDVRHHFRAVPGVRCTPVGVVAKVSPLPCAISMPIATSDQVEIPHDLSVAVDRTTSTR